MAQDRIAETRARRALQGIGHEVPAVLKRASSTRNEVHIGPREVVRVNCRPDQRLRREAMICRTLPPERYMPRVLGFSGETGFDFVVIERKPGMALSRVWPTIDESRRKSLITDFAKALKKLHAVATPPEATSLVENTHLLDPRAVTPVVPILMAIDGLVARNAVDRLLLDDLAAMVNDHGDALEDYHQRTLIHGDLSFENVMADVNGLSALLDFEWCRGAPADLELDILLRFLRYPEAHVPHDIADTLRAKDFEDVPTWIAQEYPELFSHPRIVERLALYSVAFDMAELSRMPTISTDRNMGPLHPVKRLQALLNGVSPLREQLKRLALQV